MDARQSWKVYKEQDRMSFVKYWDEIIVRMWVAVPGTRELE